MEPTSFERYLGYGIHKPTKKTLNALLKECKEVIEDRKLSNSYGIYWFPTVDIPLRGQSMKRGGYRQAAELYIRLLINDSHAQKQLVGIDREFLIVLGYHKKPFVQISGWHDQLEHTAIRAASELLSTQLELQPYTYPKIDTRNGTYYNERLLGFQEGMSGEKRDTFLQLADASRFTLDKLDLCQLPDNLHVDEVIIGVGGELESPWNKYVIGRTHLAVSVAEAYHPWKKNRQWGVLIGATTPNYNDELAKAHEELLHLTEAYGSRDIIITCGTGGSHSAYPIYLHKDIDMERVVKEVVGDAPIKGTRFTDTDETEKLFIMYNSLMNGLPIHKYYGEQLIRAMQTVRDTTVNIEIQSALEYRLESILA